MSDTNNLRLVVRVRDNTAIRMREIRNGDRFRVETDDPDDHLYGKGGTVFTARADAHQDESGVWGVQIDEGIV